MKRNAKLWWIAIIVSACTCLLSGLLFVGCVSRSEPIDPVIIPPEEFTAIPVKMKPQEPVEFPVGGLGTSSAASGISLPSSLNLILPPSKVVSYNAVDLNKVGSGFDPLLPINNVEGFGDVGKFTPYTYAL